ncbi:MAG: TonB-dependent receptor [Bacteroidales bacterium]|nr:TonB-dependent receptor [Bacteroidales bacterium]
MVNKILVLFLLFFAFASPSVAQQIRVDASNQTLSRVLQQLSTNYGVQLSFNDKLLSGYFITMHQEFDDPGSALAEIIRPFPLAFEVTGNVFIIFSIMQTKQVKPEYRLAGQVLEKYTNEALPYSHVIINGHPTISGLNGSFTYSSGDDSIFLVKASQLGYYILDTILKPGTNHVLLLTPSVIGLKEVVVSGQKIEKSTQIGDQPGVEKLNHKTANFLPGFGDNSVYNLLRLQPGILASGEQTSEPTIWGGYAGQSRVMFDGFTIYGLKNFNDNISVFNPLITKSIEVLKGGYDARYGERVSGIVDIAGINGVGQKPAFEFCVSNMTLNGMVTIPVVKNKSSIMFSLRQTYYELFDTRQFNIPARNNQQDDSSGIINLDVIPDYKFRDMNLKYSARINNKDLFYISLYGANDDFSYSLDEPLRLVNLIKITGEKINQGGGSAFYGKTWKNGNTSDFMVSVSEMKSVFTDMQGVENQQVNYRKITRDNMGFNRVDEFIAKIDNRIAVKQNQTFEFGGGLYVNRSFLEQDTFDVETINLEERGARTFVYFQNLVSNGSGSSFKFGLRATYAHNLNTAYLEPRLSASIRVAGHWKINAAWGLYNQYLVKSSIINSFGNYSYIWAVSNNEDVPVTQASHYVLGTSFTRHDFTFSLEGFYKTTTGLSRYIYSPRFNIEGVFKGNSRSYGMDVMLQKDYRGHQAWIAYTLSKVEEHFEYRKKNTDYLPSPQDQRHEIKMAVLANFDPVYFSASYVYGSGFPFGTVLSTGFEEAQEYSRLDVSFIYKFPEGKINAEIGLSVLNVLNTQNLKYENFERFSSIHSNSIKIYTEAIPVTPALYFKTSL